MPRRSVLFSPGDDEDKITKALNGDADVVVLDLEDAVSPDRKEEARSKVLNTASGTSSDSEIWVRINPLNHGGNADIESLHGLDAMDGVVYPKSSNREIIQRLGYVLNANSMDVGVIPIIESAKGVMNAGRISGVGDVTALIFGAEDLAADIGARRTKEGLEVIYSRQKVVTAASANNLTAIDTLYTDFKDMDGLRKDVDAAIDMGFDGKLAIHPDQVSVINEAFRPSSDDVEWARKVLKRKDEVDTGVFEVDGEMIDAPLIKQAERIMKRDE